MKFKTKSFLRIEQYKALSKLSIDGKILDVGGSKKSGYHELIKGDHIFTTGNINLSYGADVEFDAMKRWPFPDNSFDAVLFINLLEHLSDYQTTISEGYRVLKPGGRVVGVVPFMFNVHGSPSDYFRYTNFALIDIFTKAEFSNITVKELGTGAFSVAYHIFIGFVRWDWLASIFIPIFALGDHILSLIKKNNKMSAKYMPLGYYFEAKK